MILIYIDFFAVNSKVFILSTQHRAKFESIPNRMTFEYAPNMMIVKVHPHSKVENSFNPLNYLRRKWMTPVLYFNPIKLNSLQLFIKHKLLKFGKCCFASCLCVWF